MIDTANIDAFSSEQVEPSQLYFHHVPVGLKEKGKGGFDSSVSGEDEETPLLGLGLELE